MVIDEILDRKDGCKYDPEYLVESAETFGFNYISDAFKSKNEESAKAALNKYVDENDYGHINGIHDYINNQQWIPDSSKKQYDYTADPHDKCVGITPFDLK